MRISTAQRQIKSNLKMNVLSLQLTPTEIFFIQRTIRDFSVFINSTFQIFFSLGLKLILLNEYN